MRGGRGLRRKPDSRHRAAPAHGYTNLVELLFRLGRLDELSSTVQEGLAFARERGFRSHAYNLEVHRCLVLLRRGDFTAAADGLRVLSERVAEPGTLAVYSVPWAGPAGRPARVSLWGTPSVPAASTGDFADAGAAAGAED